MRYVTPISLALVVLMALVACSSTDIEATVEARLGQERAIEATVEARVKKEQASKPTATPWVVRVTAEPTPTPWVVRVTATPTLIPTPTITPTPKPKPTATRVRPTWTPVPTRRPTKIPTPTYAPPSPVGVWDVSFTFDDVVFPGTLWVFYEDGTVCTFALDDYSCMPLFLNDDWTWELHGSSIVIEFIDCPRCTSYSGTFSRETMSGTRNVVNRVVVDGYSVDKRQPECCWNALRIK